MKITERMLSITMIVLTILILFFGFEYVNNLVSYKYEVQDSQQIGKDPLYGLDEHQIGIMHTITFCKIASISCLVLLVVTPQVFGRINFYKKFVTNEEEAPPNPPRRGGL